MDLLNYRDKGGQNPLASILRKDSIVLGIAASILSTPELQQCTQCNNSLSEYKRIHATL
jgi:hypothetical protein